MTTQEWAFIKLAPLPKIPFIDMNTIVEISNRILRRTNGGLDIIMSLYPQARERKSFKIREERTASCSLYMHKDGNYTIRDFGTSDPAKNAIQLYAEYHGLDYVQATLQLAREYHIETGQRQEKNEAKFRKIDISEWKEEKEFVNNFCFDIKEFTKYELKTLGPFVTKEVCEKYSLYSLKWYAKREDGKITIVSSTDTFPIFIFIFGDNNKSFYKILQPKSEDKQWRFFWKGTKPKDFIGGLSILEQAYNKRKSKAELSQEDNSSADDDSTKIDKVFICSGERDAINMASLGYFVLWQNSETAELRTIQYQRIMKSVETLYNVPDLDETGRRAGHSLAMKYLEIRTLWLPNWIRHKKDWRGNIRKDLCDYFDLHSYYDIKVIRKNIKNLIYTSFPMRFWDEDIEKKRSYIINSVFVFNFLKRNGFYRLDAPHEKDSYKYIHIDEHIVREIKGVHIKEYINSFAETRRLPIGLRNVLYNTTRLSESQLTALPRIELDFTNCSKDAQFLFFSNSAWHITKNDIISFQENKTKKYIWRDDTIDALIERKINRKLNPRAIKVEKPYFKITKDKFSYDIEILENDCEFLNFMIQISRMYWKSEVQDLGEEEKTAYWKENRFNIASEKLDDIQQREHKGHLVNKLYALGYLLHQYKVDSRPWLVYAMENELVDDDESKGGSGKSLFLKSPSFLMNTKVLGSRNAKIWDNQHIFEGVTEQTSYMLFDDASKYFKLENLYTILTGGIDVNPKNQKQYTIPFHKAPKFGVTSNYSLRHSDDSTLRRLLFVSTSDYYHAAGEYYERECSPRDDFKHDLFKDWNDYQWNKYINLCAQAIQFYLSVNEKINPPMDTLLLRNLQAEIGPTFMEWADYYINNKIGEEFSKREAIDHLKVSTSTFNNITATSFIKRIKAWCKFKGYIYMPTEATDSSGRIQKRNIEGKIEDYILIADKYPLDISEDEPTKDNRLPF